LLLIWFCVITVVAIFTYFFGLDNQRIAKFGVPEILNADHPTLTLEGHFPGSGC